MKNCELIILTKRQISFILDRFGLGGAYNIRWDKYYLVDYFRQILETHPTINEYFIKHCIKNGNKYIFNK